MTSGLGFFVTFNLLSLPNSFYIFKTHADLTAFGELEIGTVVPPLSLPAPVPTTITPTINNTVPSVSPEEEGGGEEAQSRGQGQGRSGGKEEA